MPQGQMDGRIHKGVEMGTAFNIALYIESLFDGDPPSPNDVLEVCKEKRRGELFLDVCVELGKMGVMLDYDKRD